LVPQADALPRNRTRKIGTTYLDATRQLKSQQLLAVAIQFGVDVDDKQTAETALLFLQLIMRRLRRQQTAVGRPARTAVVVPNGTLFGDGVCARIKEELLKDFNLHTIVRLPTGVFAPYTPIPTNILFFDRSGPTKDVWYYEQPLPEMRDAAGDSGEFYTPRPVVRFMVTVTDPRLGETVLDPACGTGGFLVEAFNHLSKQVKTVAQRKVLQEKSLFGYEPKSLPYLLSQMNLLLHGLDAPKIDSGNALRFKLSEIGEKDRFDVVLTNPPFGGEEEKGVQGNFLG
jgi:type I restriction-modification system DNA methylase subunit